MKIFSYIFNLHKITELYDSWDLNAPVEIGYFNPLVRAGSARADGPGEHPIVLWMSPRMETPQHVWATYATLREKAGFLLGPDETSCVSVCVVLPLSASEETSSIFLTGPSVQPSQPLLILRDAPVPYSSSWLFVLQYIHASLALGSPEPGIELQIYCWLEKGHLSPSAGNTLPSIAQEAAGFLCCKGTLHVGSWPTWCSHQDSLTTLCWAPFQQTIPIT